MRELDDGGGPLSEAGEDWISAELFLWIDQRRCTQDGVSLSSCPKTGELRPRLGGVELERHRTTEDLRCVRDRENRFEAEAEPANFVAPLATEVCVHDCREAVFAERTTCV